MSSMWIANLLSYTINLLHYCKLLFYLLLLFIFLRLIFLHLSFHYDNFVVVSSSSCLFNALLPSCLFDFLQCLCCHFLGWGSKSCWVTDYLGATAWANRNSSKRGIPQSLLFSSGEIQNRCKYCHVIAFMLKSSILSMVKNPR